LEFRVVKVCLLGWWTNKAKGYQLKDLESGKLIVSWNVQFFKDDTPSNLTVISINTLRILTMVVDKFVDDALAKENITAVA